MKKTVLVEFEYEVKGPWEKGVEAIRNQIVTDMNVYYQDPDDNVTLTAITFNVSSDRLLKFAKAIAYGLQQPEASMLTRQEKRNIISEIAHSMNRKGLVNNEDVGDFTETVYKIMKL